MEAKLFGGFGDRKLDKGSGYRKVLIIAYVFPPIAYAGSYRTLRFCKYLPEYGWQPHVLSIEEADDLDNDYSPLKRLPGQVKVYRTRTIDFWRMWRRRTVRKGPNVRKTDAPAESRKVFGGDRKKRGLLGNIKKFLWELVTIPDHMVFWIPFAVLKGIGILKKEDCELIYTTSPPHSEQIIGLILSKVLKKPWVADFRDPLLYGSGYAPASKIRLRIDQLLEKLIVKNADKVIIISHYYLKSMCERYPSAKHKFIVLPNGFDPETFEKAASESFDKFTILYSGSFYDTRKPEFFLRGFSKWLAKQCVGTKDGVQVLVFGPESNDGKRIVREEGLESIVHFCGMIPQELLVAKQKGADLLLLIIGFDSESRGIVTSKIFEYMACNRPILAIIPEGDASAILGEYGLVYWVSREDDEILIRCLDRAYKHYLNNDNHLYSLSQDICSNKANAYNARRQTGVLVNMFLEILSSS